MEQRAEARIANITDKINKIEGLACYVLITCCEPSPEGNMQVEMSYEGDPMLASYLLESAQGSIDIS